MKYSLYTILLILMLTACGARNRIEKTLDAVDTMLNENPDSAYILLNTLSEDIEKQSTDVKMRYAFMLTDAKNKCFISLADDSLMEGVVRYYDSWGSQDEMVRAHYLQGCVYRDMNDAPSALRCYRDAVAIADTTSENCNYRQLMKIYGQIASVYWNQRSPELLIETARMNKYYAEKAGIKKQSLISDEYIIDGFEMLGQEDSVVIYTNRLIKDFQNEGLYSDATYKLPSLIKIYLNRGDNTNAKRAMDIYETQSGLFRNHVLIDKTKEIYYSLKGQYYENIEKLDSALYHYDEIKNSIYIDCRLEAFKGLMSVKKKQGNYSKGIEYANRYCQLADSMAMLRSAEEVNRMTVLYNYNAQNEKRKRAEERLNQYRIILIVAMVITFVILYIVMTYNSKRKRRIMEILKATNSKYLSTLNRMNKAQDELVRMKTDTVVFKKEKEAEIRSLQTKLAEYYPDDEEVSSWEKERQIYTCQKVQDAHKLASIGKRVTESELASLKTLVSKNLPEFYEFIDSEKRGLTDKEKNVCILIRLRFIPSELASLLDLSVQNVTNLRSRINKKLFNQSGAKSLNTRLLAMS